MKSGLELAREHRLMPIEAIAERLGLLPEEVEPCGRFKTKVSLLVLDRPKDVPDAKRVCVTGITATKAGAGNTTTLVRPTQGLGAIGKNPVACLRKPSVGPVFGDKGETAGGDLSQAVRVEELNLHFTGDIHVIGAANNLLAAMIDASDSARRSPRNRRVARLWWQALDTNGRALRKVTVGPLGRAHGYARNTGLDITAASEVMRVVAVARDLHDLRDRLSAITAACSRDANRSRPGSSGPARGITVLLTDALRPNLVQTLEGQPVLIHCGPLASMDHRNNSLVADLVAMKLGDDAVTESGFGSDLGMEKLFSIVCRYGGLIPSPAVLVVTGGAPKHDRGVAADQHVERSAHRYAIELGMARARRHLTIIKTFGVPAFVAVNRRPTDTPPPDHIAFLDTFQGRGTGVMTTISCWRSGP